MSYLQIVYDRIYDIEIKLQPQLEKVGDSKKRPADKETVRFVIPIQGRQTDKDPTAPFWLKYMIFNAQCQFVNSLTNKKRPALFRADLLVEHGCVISFLGFFFALLEPSALTISISDVLGFKRLSKSIAVERQREFWYAVKFILAIDFIGKAIKHIGFESRIPTGIRLAEAGVDIGGQWWTEVDKTIG